MHADRSLAYIEIQNNSSHNGLGLGIINRATLAEQVYCSTATCPKSRSGVGDALSSEHIQQARKPANSHPTHEFD